MLRAKFEPSASQARAGEGEEEEGEAAIGELNSANRRGSAKETEKKRY